MPSESGWKNLGGFFDYDNKIVEMNKIEQQLSDPKVWKENSLLNELNLELNQIKKTTDNFEKVLAGIKEINELYQLAQEDEDLATLEILANDFKALSKTVATLEFQKMFNRKTDKSNAFLDIQAGSGGTEAQDWAEMLMRMYLKWAENKQFKTSILEVSHGEVAGIKSATINISGDYAFGWTRTETGVHRLVRKSPFDSGSRRHTSFASIFVSPEISEKIEIDLKQSDVRIDTYRASGAGGQHVNKTDSAVRLTHLPSGVVVQCQNQRSQHKNKEQAFKLLRGRLFEIEEKKRRDNLKQVENNKADIGWGSQIRSYVLDQSRIKDLRTGVESGNTTSVLDGNIDMFVEASLKKGI